LDINLYSFRNASSVSAVYIQGKLNFMKVSSTPIDCDISTLNVLFYRSPNFMPYSNVSAGKAAKRGGGLEGGSTGNNKTAYMYRPFEILTCLHRTSGSVRRMLNVVGLQYIMEIRLRFDAPGC